MEYIALVASMIWLFRTLDSAGLAGRLRWSSGALAVMLVCVSPLAVFVYSDLVYAERIIAPLLLLFCVFFLEGRHVPAFVCAAYATYCKETAFVPFCVFSLSFLLFAKDMSRADRRFHLLVLGNGALFLVVWLAVLYPGVEEFYSGGGMFGPSGRMELLADIAGWDSIVLLAPAMALVRAYAVMFENDRSRLFLDAMLFASAVCIGSYVVMGGDRPSYYMPAAMLGIPAVSCWLCGLVARARPAAAVLVSVAVASVVLLDFSKSFRYADSLLYRRENEAEAVRRAAAAVGSGGRVYRVGGFQSRWLSDTFAKLVRHVHGARIDVVEYDGADIAPGDAVIFDPSAGLRGYLDCRFIAGLFWNQAIFCELGASPGTW